MSRIAQPLISRGFLVLMAAGLFVVGVSLSFSAPVQAAAGINKTINYQGRLLNSAGAVVADGTYNVQFKIYQDGAGTAAGNPGGTLMWTESWVYGPGAGGGWADRRLTVKNGYFSVALGSICSMAATTCAADSGNSQTNTVVDFNQDTLWLSVNIGNTTQAATFAGASGDGEMLPMKRMSAAPYALQAANASALGGIAASGFIQNSTNLQTATYNIQSTGVNNTTAALRVITGQNSNVLEIRDDSGNAIAGVAASGAIYSAPSGATIPSNARLFVQPLASSSTAIIARAATSATGDIIQLQDSTGANMLASFGPSGNLAFGNTSDKTISIVAAASGNNGNNLTVQAGNGTGTNKNGGNLTLQAGSSTGTGTPGNVIVKALADVAVLGVELMTGAHSFGAAAGWGSLSGTGQTATATHSTGTTAISPTPAFSISAGVTYQVTFTISGMTSGLVTPRIGGTDGQGITINSVNQTQLITATNTGNLQFVPRTDFVGTISGVSVKVLTTSPSTFTVANTNNTPALEVRTGGGGKFTTAIGTDAFQSNVSGMDNTAIGDTAMRDSTTGNQNTALGSAALQGNTNGSDNTGIGFGARAIGTSGSGNTSVGSFSHAVQLTAGSNNTALGYQAGNSDLDTFFSYDTTNSTTIGAYAQAQADNSLILGGAGQHKVNVGIGTTIPTNTFSVSPVRYDIGTASTSGASTTVTGVGTSWLANASIGDEIIFDFGSKRTITAVNSDTQIIVNSSVTAPALSKYRIHYAGLQVTSAGKVGVGTTAPTANLQVSTLTNTATAFQVQNASSTAILNANTQTSLVSVRGGADSATTGSELNTQTNFSTSWGGTGWTRGATTATHTSGTTALSPTTPLSIVAGNTYRVTFTVSGMTPAAPGFSAGLVTVSLGGENGNYVDANSTQTQLITASTTGNLAFTPSTDFLGIISNVSVMQITSYGPTLEVLDSSGANIMSFRGGTNASSNTFVGSGAGSYNIPVSTTLGNGNTALGTRALQSNTSGNYNTAIGNFALIDNTTGTDNNALGRNSLSRNTSGDRNVAFGGAALLETVTGSNNIGMGYFAGYSNKSGSANTLVGYHAGYQDPDGFYTYSNLQNATALGANAQVQNSNTLILGGAGVGVGVGSSNAVKVGIGTSVPDNILSVAPAQYNTGTASQNGTTVTGIGTTWTSAMVGQEIIFTNGVSEIITGFTSSTQLTVNNNFSAFGPLNYRIHHPGLQVTSAGKVGVGTLAPTANLQVSTPTNTSTAFQVQNATGSAALTVDTTSLNGNVSNSNFEVDTTGWVASGTGASIARNTTEKYSGDASLAFTTGTAVGNSARLTVGTALSTSTTYTFNFYAKAGTAFSTLSASYSPDGTAANERDCAILDPSSSVVTTGWTRYTCTINTSSTTATASGYVAIKQSDATSRVVYVDAVQIEAGNAITQAAIANTGFETNTSGWAYVGTPGSIARSTADKYNGAASMLITTTNNANNGAKYTTGNTNPTQLATNTSYTLSFWAKSTGTALTNMTAAYARDGTVQVDCTLNSATLSTTAWGFYSCTFTTDGTAPSASAFIIIKHTTIPGGARTWYVDDVQLTPTSFVGNGTSFKESGLTLNGVVNSAVALKNQSDSTTAFRVQNTANASVFNVDTLNQRVGINVANPTDTLHMDGKLRFASPVETVFDGNAKLFVGIGPETAADGSLDNTSRNLIESYGGTLNSDVQGIVMQWGGAIDAAGFKLSNDGMMIWGSGDTDLLSVMDEDNNAVRMVIDDAGSVGFGTENPSVQAHFYRPTGDNVLRVGANGGVVAMQLSHDEDNATASAWAFVSAGGTGGDLEIIEDRPVGTYRRRPYYLDANAATGAGWVSDSDARLKENVETLKVLDSIDKLRGVSFTWKSSGEHQIGVIAQEIQQAFPELIGESNGYLGVMYDKLGVLALQGVKELNDKDNSWRSQAVMNGGDARFAALNISGRTTLDTLTVKGEAVFENKVTVKELIAQENLTVHGHVISGGGAPAIEPAQDNQVAIEGTDTAGTITVTPSGVATGELANITFTKAYSKAPRITITGTNAAGSKLPVYPDKTAAGFKLLTEIPPAAGTVYRYDYIVIE